MRIALIGAGGQLASDLQLLLPDATALSHKQIEISDPESVAAALSAAQPALVINTAAYNLVDQAEDEPQRAFAVNAEGPRNLARWCRSRAAFLVHISTDYVFGGDAARRVPYRESDPPAPLGQYGHSKLAGEAAVIEDCPNSLIVRTCGLYGRSATRVKGNFVATMLRLARERSEIRVVNDQRCTPSYTADVAAGIVSLLRAGGNGLFHLTNSGETTWRQLAQEALRRTGIDTPVLPIPSSEYPAKAARPSYSVLDCGKAAALVGAPLPPWQEALERYLQTVS